jgi:hypothetical protein
MGVILVDLADDEHDLRINWWNWRPILAFLREGNLIDAEQFERMGFNGGGGQLTGDEALKAAAFLRREIIPRMKDGERMHADGEVSAAPREPQLISQTSSHDLYAAHKACIESFASFCEVSKGFKVY